MKSLVFLNQKGGVGKTSITSGIAFEKAVQGFKTLIIDCDDQGNMSRWVAPGLVERELADVLMDRCLCGDAIIPTKTPNLWILPTISGSDALKVYAKTLANESPFIMKKLIRKIKVENFDFVFFDVPPNFMAVTESCLLAADEAVVVMNLDSFSSNGLETLLGNISKMQERYETDLPAVTKIVANRRDKRKAVQEATYRDLLTAMPAGFNLFVFPTDEAFPKAQMLRCPVQSVSDLKKETQSILTTLAQAV